MAQAKKKEEKKGDLSRRMCRVKPPFPGAERSLLSQDTFSQVSSLDSGVLLLLFCCYVAILASINAVFVGTFNILDLTPPRPHVH